MFLRKFVKRLTKIKSINYKLFFVFYHFLKVSSTSLWSRQVPISIAK